MEDQRHVGWTVGPIIGCWPGAGNKLLANHLVLFELQLPVQQQPAENQRSRWLVITKGTCLPVSGGYSGGYLLAAKDL